MKLSSNPLRLSGMDALRNSLSNELANIPANYEPVWPFVSNKQCYSSRLEWVARWGEGCRQNSTQQCRGKSSHRNKRYYE